MSHTIVADCAPLAQTGAVNVTSASGPGTAVPPPVEGAVGVTDAMCPCALNVTLPAATTAGAPPAGGGFTSAPGTVTW